MTNPWTLDYWNSGEYQAAREKLDDDVKAGYGLCPPDRKSMFKALSAVPQREVRCAIIGQDPYPDPRFATGIAFSIPSHYTPREFPHTLREIFAEYQADLGYPPPCHGDLGRWTEQGVLLWNAIPSCRAGQSLSHNWRSEEWRGLTREIVRRLSSQSIVFAFLGGVARSFAGDVLDETGSVVIETSHPSPRGSLNSRTPFRGSRLFSTINDRLNSLNIKPIDWRLDDAVSRTKDLQSPDVGGSRILPNETGVDLGGQQGHT